MRASRKTVRKTSGIASRALQRQNKPTNPTTPLHPLLHLQQTSGNQAVGRLVQLKLKVGQPGDRFEQEADRVADQILRVPEPHVQRQEDEAEENEEMFQAKPLAGRITPLIQRQAENEAEDEEETVQTRPVRGQTAGQIQRQMEDEEEESIQTKLISPSQSMMQRQEEPKEDEEEALQSKETSGHTFKVTPGIAANIDTLRGGGQPLPGFTRAYFESRFGYDFGGVRVHSGARAAESARAIDAQAFTIGKDVAFAAGQYSPETMKGKRLLAHELTHVVQQNAPRGVSERSVYGQSHASEHQEQGLRNGSTLIQRKVVVNGKKWRATKDGRAWLRRRVKNPKKRRRMWKIFEPMLRSKTKSYTYPDKASLYRDLLRRSRRPVRRGISYERLLKDKKLEIGVAIGYPFLGEYKRLVGYLKKQKFSRLGSPLLDLFRMIGGLIPIVKRFLKKGVERWQRIKRFWLGSRKAKKKKPIDVEVSIDLINQESEDPKKHFAEFLSSKEIAIYSGHARYGTGPDFDPKKSVKENFVIGVNSALHKTGKLKKGYSKKVNKALKGRANDLEAMSRAGRFDPKLYQVWFFNACKTIHYLDEIRGGLVKGKDRTNLRFVGTRRDISIDVYALPFIDGILKEQSIKQILNRLNKAETKERKEAGEKTRKSYYFSD